MKRTDLGISTERSPLQQQKVSTSKCVMRDGSSKLRVVGEEHVLKLLVARTVISLLTQKVSE
jgi:hypothetical protein